MNWIIMDLGIKKISIRFFKRNLVVIFGNFDLKLITHRLVFRTKILAEISQDIS